MAQPFNPIKTEVGIISGRDAIFLDEVKVSLYPCSLELRGELNSDLCSETKEKSEWIKYSLKFFGVAAFMQTELDLRDYLRTRSSFDQITDSEWLNELREKDNDRKIKPDHQHYIVFTYDDVFDVICQSFELKLLEARLK